MASIAHLQREEKLGLGIAVVAHAALLALLLWHANRAAPIIPAAERMTVSLASDVSLDSTAPDPSQDAQASVAPELSPEPQPVPAPVTEPVPPPQQRTIQQPSPKPPKPKATEKPKPKPTASSKPATGARLGDDFLKGVSAGDRNASGSPAAKFGPAESASLQQAIARQLKPHWASPQGPDVEELVTIVRFRLNRDGSLAGNPELISQTGITPTNEAQAARHFEQAVRAIRLAAPFDLPPEFFDKWKTVNSRFDRRL